MFDAPGGDFGPDGTRILEMTDHAEGVLSVDVVGSSLPKRWQNSYGSKIQNHPNEAGKLFKEPALGSA